MGLSAGKVLVGLIIAVSVGFFIASALMPTAILNVYDANQTGWDQEAIDLWDLLPVIGILAIMLSILALAIAQL